jgi:small subunit ribosomal protein S8
MGTTDTIADMLTRVRNALRARHASVEMPSSTMRVEIAKILKEEGYIENFKVLDRPRNMRRLALQLKLGSGDKSILSGLERVSRPSCRVYVGKDDIPVILGGIGVAIISTSRGIMTGEEARRRRLGGEVLCRVW